MISAEKDRIQTEVMERMNDMKSGYSSKPSDVPAKSSFLEKFLAPFDLRNKSNDTIRVLVCEDCSLWTKLLKRALEKQGIEVITSISPVYFLNRKNLESFDLIITDNQMPYMYGTQFIEKELRLEIPIYLHSADSSLKNEVSLSKVLRGIFEKGKSLDATLSTILNDFKSLQSANLKSELELKYAVAANTLIA